MLAENPMAYKEWASITEALARGLYTMSLRKGGIHEKRGEFTVEHREYFLFPTHVHQRASDLAENVLPFLHAAQAQPEGAGRIPIRYYVAVEEARYVEDLKTALALEGLHPFSRAGVEMRFQYKKPGLWALLERVYALPETRELEDHRLYAGCRSWVPLQAPLSTAGARAVLDDGEFQRRRDAIRAVLG